MEQEVGYAQGKEYIEGLGYQEAVEWLFAFHMFEIRKPCLQSDAYECEVKPEGAE